MKTYEEAVSIVAEVRLSDAFSDVGSVFNWAGAVLLAKLYDKEEHAVANDCYDLFIQRKDAKEKAIKAARKMASRIANEERHQTNMAKAKEMK